MEEVEVLITQVRDQTATKTEKHEAFGQLVYLFQDMAYYCAYGLLNDAHLAQDAVQEAFVTAYKKLDHLRQPQAFPGWLKQIVLNQCHQFVRQNRLATKPIDATTGLVSRETDPAVTVEHNELKDKVLAAIQSLPEREQVVTRLFYLNGYSQKEIAKLLEVPVTTVKKRLQYARTRLRGIMVTMMDTLYPVPVPKPVPIPIPIRPSPPRRPDHF